MLRLLSLTLILDAFFISELRIILFALTSVLLAASVHLNDGSRQLYRFSVIGGDSDCSHGLCLVCEFDPQLSGQLSVIA